MVHATTTTKSIARHYTSGAGRGRPIRPQADPDNLMVYRVVRYAARTPGVAADDVAEEELQAFAGNAGQQRCFRPVPPWWVPSCR